MASRNDTVSSLGLGHSPTLAFGALLYARPTSMYAQIEPVPSFERARRKTSRDRARREVRVRAATD